MRFYTFIWGWMNGDRLGIRNIMLIWTVLIIIQLISSFALGRRFLALPRGRLTP